MAAEFDEPLSETHFDSNAWVVKGRELAKRHTDVRWELGEWLLEGQLHYVDHTGVRGAPSGLGFWAMASEVTGLTPSHLEDLASTARRFPRSVRTDQLSWSHHRVLINARPDSSEEELEAKLLEAVAFDLRVKEFERQLKSPIRDAKLEKSFLITVPLAAWEALRDLAKGDGTTIPDYAAGILSEHTASEGVALMREVAVRNTKERKKKKRQETARRVDNLGLQR
jgi:hypothetical protein